MNPIYWVLIVFCLFVCMVAASALFLFARKGGMPRPRRRRHRKQAPTDALPYFRFFAEEKQMFRKTRSAVSLTAEMAKRDPATGEKVGSEKVAATKYLIVGGKEIPRPIIFLRPMENIDDDSLEVAVLFYDGAPMTIEEVSSSDVLSGEPD